MYPQFDCILVVYNTDIAQIVSLKQMDQCELVRRIIVYDNSDKSNSNASEIRCIHKAEYISTGVNIGLSAAYNNAIPKCDADFICIMDDDTVFPVDYLKMVQTQIAHKDADIYLPVVIQDELIYSPCIKKRYLFRRFTSLDNFHNDGSFSAINSGMVIRRSSLPEEPYDKRFFLDMVDHKFISDMVTRGLIIELMHEVRIEQTFSFEVDDIDSAVKRLRIYAQDSKVFYSDSVDRRIFRVIQMLYKYSRLFFRKLIEK